MRGKWIKLTVSVVWSNRVRSPVRSFTLTRQPGLCDRFNDNGAQDIQGGVKEDGDLSNQHIKKRAKFLYYLSHTDPTVSNFNPDIDFVDNRLGISLEVDNAWRIAA